MNTVENIRNIKDARVIWINMWFCYYYILPTFLIPVLKHYWISQLSHLLFLLSWVFFGIVVQCVLLSWIIVIDIRGFPERSRSPPRPASWALAAIPPRCYSKSMRHLEALLTGGVMVSSWPHTLGRLWLEYRLSFFSSPAKAIKCTYSPKRKEYSIKAFKGH